MNQKKKLIKILALALMCITSTGLTMLFVFAATEKDSDIIQIASDTTKKGKTNFKILNDDLINFIYTYEEYGKCFKVKERINATLTDGKSEIYVKDNNGTYVLDTRIWTTVKFKCRAVLWYYCTCSRYNKF